MSGRPSFNALQNDGSSNTPLVEDGPLTAVDAADGAHLRYPPVPSLPDSSPGAAGMAGVLVGLTRCVKRIDVSPAQKADNGAEVYVDALGHFAAAYGGGNGECMLVRPDGYVGWVGLEENLPDLDRYVAAVLQQ